MSSAKRKYHSSECLHKKVERSYTISLASYLEALDQKGENILKRSRQQEIITLRDKNQPSRKKRTIQIFNKARIFEKIKNIGKL